MRLKKRYWAAAFCLSLAAHAGAAALLMRGDTAEVQIAGGQQFEIALLGGAFEDAISAGAESETVEPVPSPVMEEPLPPVEQPVAPQSAAEAVAPAEWAAVQPVLPDESVTATAEAADTSASETVEPQKPEQVEAEETIAALVHVPVPTARPAQSPNAVQPVERQLAPVEPVKEARQASSKKPSPPEKPQREKQATPTKRQTAGNGGNSRADARKGQADGAAAGRQAAAGKAGTSRDAGNAAVSNYPGKVVSKLRRSLRYPAAARRARLRGEVHVAFTVTGGGGVSGARVVRSSGSPVLDQAALDTVRRAAPFPPIPDGRANWSFTVPLAFTR